MTDTHQTRRRLLQMAGAAATSSVAAGVASADEHAHFRAFTAELTGNSEPHAVETDATGIAHFEVDQELEKIDYILEVDRLDNGTQAHIHLGEPGEEGPVIAWLYPEEEQQPALCEGRFTDILADGTLTVDDLVGPFADEEFDAVVDTLAAEGAYVNVHTEAYPAGEIRGQIVPEDLQDPAEPVTFDVEEVATGLTHPWALTFVPGNNVLVTERNGRLLRIHRRNGAIEEVDGTPEVATDGQGGLLDVALHPDYPAESWVYLTYAGANDNGESATHLGRGQLKPGGTELEAFEKLHVAEPFQGTNLHFGSRVVFDDEGMLYMTTGDRRDTEFDEDHVAQDTTNDLGATLRFEPDGSIPEDNPFVDDEDARDTIFSYGHRNVQAMTVHPETGELWQGEHGEEDGDEINILEAGGNYGWPVATYACEYGTNDPIGDDPSERDDLVEPVYYWECGSNGFPSSGATFYDGQAFQGWQGNLFMGNLAGQYLGRFMVDGTDVEEVEPLLQDYEWRIRDVAVAPDTGHLYLVVDDEDAPLVRLVPE